MVSRKTEKCWYCGALFAKKEIEWYYEGGDLDWGYCPSCGYNLKIKKHHIKKKPLRSLYIEIERESLHTHQTAAGKGDKNKKD